MNAVSISCTQSSAPRWSWTSRFPLEMAIAALLMAALWPVWRWYVLRLNDGSDEPMGLAALAAAAWFLWQDRKNLGLSRWSLRFATAGLTVYTVLYPWQPAMLRALLGLGIIAVAFRFHRAAPAVWALLAMSLPIVATAQFFAGWPLRILTAIGTENLLQFGGLPVTREGTQLWRDGIAVGVDAPCSGVKMLWMGLFVHFLLGARHRLRLITLVWLTPSAIVAVLAANVFRAAALYFPESGMITLPGWVHEGIGLGFFALVIAGFSRLHGRLDSESKSPGNSLNPPSPAWSDGVGFSLAAVMAAVIPWTATGSDQTGEHETAAHFPGWPAQWESRDLAGQDLSPQEESFARNFPGRVAVFRTLEGPASRRVIIRWVTRPTRKLHSSADCLQASGFAVEPRPDAISEASGESWASWIAYHPEQGRFQVRERIAESIALDRDTASWTSISGWFWDATLGRSGGPWWAVTVLEPLTDE